MKDSAAISVTVFGVVALIFGLVSLSQAQQKIGRTSVPSADRSSSWMGLIIGFDLDDQISTFCGGAIINEFWLLTTGICKLAPDESRPPKKFIFVAGAQQISLVLNSSEVRDPNHLTLQELKKMSDYLSYDHWTVVRIVDIYPIAVARGNVAVAKLSRPLELTNINGKLASIQLIEAGVDSDANLVPQNCYFLGWSEQMVTELKLQPVNSLPSRAECTEQFDTPDRPDADYHYNYPVPESDLCASIPDDRYYKGGMACKLLKKEAQGWTLIGLKDFLPLSKTNLPIALSRVAIFADWIWETIHTVDSKTK